MRVTSFQIIKHNNELFSFNKLRSKLLRALNDIGLMHREELVEEIKEPRSTIYDNLHSLEKQGLVIKCDASNGERGRPQRYWDITEKGKEVFKRCKLVG
jgi:predicted ArsR family transcriptional regulator